jgi:ribulose bisphosphate carboxylase small subunit
LTACKTASVLKQAVFEAKLKNILHEDIINEVDICSGKTIKTCSEKKVIRFRTRHWIVAMPIKVLNEKQVTAYVYRCMQYISTKLHGSVYMVLI